MKMIATTLSLLTFFSTAMADGPHLTSRADKFEHMSRSDIWIRQPWITNDFQFTNALDIAAGPALRENEHYLTQNRVYCKMTQEIASPTGTGKTPKFFCELQTQNAQGELVPVMKRSIKADGTVEQKPEKIKVKYQFASGRRNPEIYSEILATRLLWALGFAADRMFFVPEVVCVGCTNDPFNDRQVTNQTVTFRDVAIERKMDGEEITYGYQDSGGETHEGEGWSFREMWEERTTFSSDPALRQEQVIERTALLILAGFMRHSDNKRANQRFICIGEVRNNRCEGRTRLMIQDLGAVFGQGRLHLGVAGMSRVDLNAWLGAPLWENGRSCLLRLGVTYDWPRMQNARVGETGRQLILRLLKGFSEGEAGQQRLLTLFRTAHIEQINATPEQWAEGFRQKLRLLEFPAGEERSDFRCPNN